MLFPVSLGVAVATAVIVGALLVGDSVRGSLRYLATDRLGEFRGALLAPRFFDRDVIENMATNEKNGRLAGLVPVPVTLFPKATIQNSASADRATLLSSSALLLGIESSYWLVGEGKTRDELAIDEIVINEALATKLDASVGERLTVRLPSLTAVPADSPLGRRDSETINLPGLKIKEILPNASIARFNLRSDQRESLNAFVSMKAIQEALSRPNQINACLFARDNRDRSSSTGSEYSIASEEIQKIPGDLPVTLADLGFNLSKVERIFPDQSRGESSSDERPRTIFSYWHLTSDQMLFPDSVVEAIGAIYPPPQSSSILTYLANGIEKTVDSEKVSVPYSTIAGVDPKTWTEASVGFAFDAPAEDMPWTDDEVMINEWAANRLGAKVGDDLKLDYYLPETMDGEEVEKTFTVKVRGILPFTEPAIGYNRSRPARFQLPPTPFNDPALTPEVPGITDQDSISDWELPFKLTRTIPKEDDVYWGRHRLSPKLFMTLKKAQQLFGSRFGKVSSIRFSTDVIKDREELERKLLDAVKPSMTTMGWQWLPIYDAQLAAAKGTTPFDLLFLSLSFFVILAAIILVVLLFRLSIERRASQWGTLLAVGWTTKALRSLLSMEGLLLAVFGGLLGIAIGFIYAYAIIALLKSWWVGAVGSPFLQFFASPQSIALGYVVGIVFSWLAIRFAIRQITKRSTTQLLKGQIDVPTTRRRTNSWFVRSLLALSTIATLGLVAMGFTLQGQAAGGAFVGAGFFALLSLLGMVWGEWLSLHRSRLLKARTTNASPASFTLRKLSMTAVQRQPLRTILAIGLMAVATFLILSMSLFEVRPTALGTGGFQWLAESNMPLAKSLNDVEYVREVLGDKVKVLENATIVPMRVKEGDDAGCNNLYQATQPKVIGLSPRIVDYSSQRNAATSFAWAASEALPDTGTIDTPWKLLERSADGSESAPFPAIIDQNTAMWALHLTGGIGQRFEYEFDGLRIHFVTVALLQNTILQGAIILGEENFKRAFPDVSGYRSWLIAVPTKATDSGVAGTLQVGWADEGMSVDATEKVLERLLAVQNTYLRAFQSLGLLGLLLGAIGLAVVQLRSAMERRGELALMRAIGFDRSRVGMIVFVESLVLLLGGLLVGMLAAAVAVAPAVARGEVQAGWCLPLIMVAGVLVSGCLASVLAVRQAMSPQVLESLRQG